MRNRDDVRRLKVSELTFAREYNRDIDKGWVRKIVEGLVEVPPVIEVACRGESCFVIIDGQHRVQAVLQKWGPNATVLARVHHSLTLGEEAALFYRLNQRRNLRPYNAFHSLVVANAPEAIDIVKVLDHYGLTYGQTPTANVVAAIAAMRTVYDKHGIAILDAAFGLLLSAWGRDAATWDHNLIRGMALFLEHYPDADLQRLRSKIASYKSGAVGFLRDAKGAAKPLQMSTDRAVVWLLVETYNKGGRGKGDLAPWR